MKNQEYHKIKLSQKDGFGRFYFIHSSCYEIHYHQDVRPQHPNEETKFIQTELYEYNLVNGVNIPFKIVERDLETGNKLSELITETAEINPRFVSTEFEIQKVKSIM